MKPYADNVFLELEPQEAMSAGGIHLPQRDWLGARGHRFARVIAVGPGYYRQKPAGARGTVDSAFIPTELKPQQRVIVDALAGSPYEGDLSAPRHNLKTEYGLFRIVREQEILAVVEDGEAS